MSRPRQIVPFLVWLLMFVSTITALGSAEAQAQLAPPGEGVIRALVIGADHYAAHRSLRGAIADVRDLEQCLQKGGVRDLAVLVEEKASRRETRAAMDRLVGSSRPGDLVIISFAGH